MPLPLEIDLPFYLNTSCAPAPLTLAEITAAYVAADTTDQQNFWNTLADGTYGFQFIANCLNNGITAGDTYDGGVIVNDLHALGGFYSPTFPPPTTNIADIPGLAAELSTDEGNISTLQGQVTDLQTQINVIDVDGTVVTPVQLVDVFGQLNMVQLAAIGINFYSAPTNCPTITVESETDQETEPWLDGAKAAACALLLTLHAPTGEPDEMKEVQTVWAPDCDPISATPVRLALAAPFSIIGTNSDAALWQELFNILAYLLRCCPPCSPDTWVFKGVTDGSVAETGLALLDAIKLGVAELEEAIDTSNGWPETTFTGDNTGITVNPEPWQRLAQVRWVYADGTRGEMMLWRFHMQVFRCPTGDVIGYEILSQPGVSYSIYHRFVAYSHSMTTW